MTWTKSQSSLVWVLAQWMTDRPKKNEHITICYIAELAQLPGYLTKMATQLTFNGSWASMAIQLRLAQLSSWLKICQAHWFWFTVAEIARKFQPAGNTNAHKSTRLYWRRWGPKSETMKIFAYPVLQVQTPLHQTEPWPRYHTMKPVSAQAACHRYCVTCSEGSIAGILLHSVTNS